MKNMDREAILKETLAGSPAYRFKQLKQAIFDVRFHSWKELTSIDKILRQKLEETLPYLSVSDPKIFTSKADGSQKSILTLGDGELIETVLMKNSRNQYTICLSSQVGCAMGCRFCATGKMGLIRNLSADEIVDQYRFWLYHLGAPINDRNKITNIVIMGMGEPLANYDDIKNSLNDILKYTEIGPTHITVSTIGLFPILDKILADPNWPNVRLAISLHAPNLAIRKKIIPSTPEDYFIKLFDWSKEYLAKFGNRSHYLSFEYIMINGLNDSLVEAKELAELIKNIGQVKVNLIPCNGALDPKLKKSQDKNIRAFSEYLIQNGIRSTVRQSQGQDIAAACGQLITKKRPL